MPRDWAAVRALLAKATPGPWALDPTGDLGWTTIGTADRAVATVDEWDGRKSAREDKANAALIVAAVNALPAALDELDRLTRWLTYIASHGGGAEQGWARAAVDGEGAPP